MDDARAPVGAGRIAAQDFAATGGVLPEEAGPGVAAFGVDQREDIRRASGLRIDHAGRSVLLPGDGGPHPEAPAQGRDERPACFTLAAAGVATGPARR